MKTQKKIAVVTGGSRDPGKDMAMNRAKNGIDVFLTYNTKHDEALAVVKAIDASGRTAEALQFSAGDIKGLPTFLEHLKSVLKNKFKRENFDSLINNAGIGTYAPFTDTTEEQFDTLMNIHFKGVFSNAKSLALVKRCRQDHQYFNRTCEVLNAGSSAYASMKSAVETLSRYLAKS